MFETESETTHINTPCRKLDSLNMAFIGTSPFGRFTVSTNLNFNYSFQATGIMEIAMPINQILSGISIANIESGNSQFRETDKCNVPFLEIMSGIILDIEKSGF